MKIACCGSAPSSLNLAPFKDARYEEWSNKTQLFPTPDFANEEWQIWGCSPSLWAQAPRADRWFETHRWEPGQSWFSPEYVSFLQYFRGPVYTGGPVPEIRNAVEYPIERVEAEFSSYFLHSSLSLMAALAILEIEDDRARDQAGKVMTKAQETQWHQNRADVIGFWGVDMAANEEYGDQRSGCHFFILEAMRRGIGVYVPPESCLLRPKPIYGLSEWDHSYIKATQRARELNGRKNQAEQQLHELTKSANFLAGALDNHDYWIKTWTSPYGIPAGLVINHQPGTGLGGGITMNRPFSPPENHVIEHRCAQGTAGCLDQATAAVKPTGKAKTSPAKKTAPKARK